MSKFSLTTLLGTLCFLAPGAAFASGGQPGIDIAVDAPWRIEPIPEAGGFVGGTPKYTYGPIPIVITIQDAIFDVNRRKLPTVGLGAFDRVIVEEVTGKDPSGWKTTLISRDDLTEIEAKYGVSQPGKEPEHERCAPAMGMVNCDTRLPIDRGKTKVKQASHEWHASFSFTPKLKIEPGKEIMLRVTLFTTGSTGKKFSYTTSLKVHPGEAPMPRFANTWLYGDLHYHSQSTDNEGESGYSYRNIVRAMGSMGMDFVFATDHASDGVQAMGGGSGIEDKVLDAFGYVEDFNEARDLNGVRFQWANGAIHGSGGANEVMLADALKAGSKAYFPNYKGYGVVPQIFMGEEIDSWPYMSDSEAQSGKLVWGDRQSLEWWRADACAEKYVLTCAGGPKIPNVPEGKSEATCRAEAKAACMKRRSTKKDGRWHLTDAQGGTGTSAGSRMHMVYLPYSTKGTQGWISGHTSTYGGATKSLASNLAGVDKKGRAFLAHPLEGGNPDDTPGPNMVPYSRSALDAAWRSRGILGLQLWNEDDHYVAGPDNAFSGNVVTTGKRGEIQYQPAMWRGSPWHWNYGEAKSKDRCDDCDTRFRLYHGAFVWDTYLRKGLNPAVTKGIKWLPKGEPRKWSMAGGSDAHGDLNFRRYGRPDKCIKNEKVVVVKVAQWCDTRVSDSGIGKPRNLVHVGKPTGPGSGSLKRHSNRQVIDALDAGRFSVTDGPALRIVVDNNRNGKIDDGDYEMGSVVDVFPEEQVPLLVEWFSTPEFGPVQRVDLYVGNKAKTFAAPNHGPDGRFGFHTKENGQRVKTSLKDPYAGDPSGVLATTGLSGDKAMHGLAKVMLDPKQFGVSAEGALFYVRAYAQTAEGPGKVAGQMAFTNPVWGRYHMKCSTDAPKSLDKDGNRTPDVCEGKAPRKNGSTRGVVALGGPPKAANPGVGGGAAPGTKSPVTPAPKVNKAAPINKLPTTKVPASRPPAKKAAPMK
jgi:hypothetical protein